MPEATALDKYTATVSDEQFLKDEKLIISQKPIGLVTQSYLHIKTKSADLISLVLNVTQKSIVKIIFKLLKENKPIRLWILKSRQQGVSTLTEGIIYALTSQQENVNSLIMADEKDHANNLFDMSKLYQEQLEKHYPHIAPKLKKSNEKKLEFENTHSQIIIATAENLEAARSHTFTNVHLCLGGDSQILLSNGRIKNIKDVKYGDKIITHLGHITEVKGITKNKTIDIQGDDELLNISISGGHCFPIKCTRKHKIYIRDKKNNGTLRSDIESDVIFRGKAYKTRYIHGSTKVGARKDGRGEWVEAKAIVKGDMIGIPLRILHHKRAPSLYLPIKTVVTGKKWIEGKVDIDYDLGYFCGLYLSEGCIIYNKSKIPSAINLAMDIKEIPILESAGQKVSKYIKSYSIKERKDSRTTVGVYYGISFATFIANLFGKGGDKNIPNKVWIYPKEFVLGMLKGYFQGDGYVPDHEDVIYASSTRPQILFQIRDILLGMRIGYSSIDFRKGGYRYGRNCKDIWTIRLHGNTSNKLRELLGFKVIPRDNTNKIRKDWKLGRKHCWVKVDNIGTSQDKDVYDLILDHPDHSFRLVNGVAVHNSECAFFRDLKAVMKGLNQTVPDLPNTMIIGETTANGMEMFYDEWMRAVQGKTDWLPVFIPWFAMEEYSMPLQSEKLYPLEGIIFDAEASQQSFIQDEQRMIDEYSLTQEQLNWRRYAIVNKCGGEMAVFHSEYPESWEVAFQTSGKAFFSQPALKKQMKQTPKRLGNIYKDEHKHIFRDLPSGHIKIYTNPQPNEQYIITADASEALGADEGSILVLNSRLNRTVAVVNGQYEPELLADISSKLGYYYNNALIAPENKGYGYMMCQCLSRTYGNIYKRKITKDGKITITDELGFNTNLNTRPEMLARAAEVILYNSCELVDADLINQCQTFIINPKTKKAEAALNKEDGLVICFAIAQQVRHEHPYRPPQNQRMAEIKAKRRIQSEAVVGTRF